MSYTNDEINLITLCSFAKLTYVQRRNLLGNLTLSEPDFVKNSESLIKSVGRSVYNKVKAEFYDENYRKKVLDELDGEGVKCVTYFSEDYPENLKATEIPPLVLYCKGDTSLLKTECFAVVGSRRTLPNILTACKKIASELTEHFTVVTGIADGADTAALEGALKSGKVISVLAYGFDFVYPSVSRRLIDKIKNVGLVISEYPPGVPPLKYRFRIRNRIIAGLARGTLVVSAGLESGALITARYAYEYGRDVFAFPYTPGISSGEGCNALIKNYGILVENTLDIFGNFGLDFKPQSKKSLSEEEELLLSEIRSTGGEIASKLAEKLNMPEYKLIPVLSKLEIMGLIVRLGGNRYAAADSGV